MPRRATSSPTPSSTASSSATAPRPKPLLDKAGVQPDAGVVPLAGKKDVDTFVGALGALRLWDREPKVKLQPEPAPARGRPASAAR